MTDISNLTREIKIALDKYKVDVDDALEESIREVSKMGVKELKKHKNFAPGSKRGKKYYKNWTYKIEKTRTNLTSTIYNKLPGLPHLLEYGHAIQNGTGKTKGRVPAYPHIAPIEEKVNKEVEKLIRKKVGE